MANWHGHARSNYFRVKDVDSLRAELEDIQIQIFEGSGENEGKITLLGADGDSGGWPNWIFSEDGEEEEFDLVGVVHPHLARGEVAVFIEIGAEKLRYLTGVAVAVNERGETEIVDLVEIYEKARTLGENVTAASY